MPDLGDLETIIAASLKRSQHLIVLCSPSAASAEGWVGREIEIFRRERKGRFTQHRERRASGLFPRGVPDASGDGKLRAPLARPAAAALGGDGRKKALISLSQAGRSRVRRALAAGARRMALRQRCGGSSGRRRSFAAVCGSANARGRLAAESRNRQASSIDR